MIKPDAYKHMGKIVNAIQRSGFMIKWVRKPLQGCTQVACRASSPMVDHPVPYLLCTSSCYNFWLCHARMHLSAHVFFSA